MSKRGFQLSINMLVVVILGILTVGGGLVLVTQLLTVAQDIPVRIGSDQEARINKLLTGSDRLAISDENVKGRRQTFHHTAM